MNKKTLLRLTARTLMLSMIYQLGFPLYSYALTSGPTQPEVQSFEPVGTTEMVDMFTGDFNYNLPLMDVEGYPINISYHSGIGPETEASWVGLGWNLNVGEITRGVRGLPDDFNGETIDKELYIKDEKNFKIASGVDVGLEVGGLDAKLKLGFNGYVQFNNYKGTSIGTSIDATISTPYVNAGVSMGVGSQTGADIDLSAGLHTSSSVSQETGEGVGVSASTGFNTRSGMKNISFNTGATLAKDCPLGFSYSNTIPIGLQNYVPVVTNASSMGSFGFQVKLGGEIFGVYPNFGASIETSKIHYDSDGSRPGYGYMYSENAPATGILDFSRDRDGRYNKTMSYLPFASTTYDVYSVCGQGTGGVFRPHRNDIGSIYDPEVKSPKSDFTSLMIEAGIGSGFEIGADIDLMDSRANSGPWWRLPFRGNQTGSFYEKAFFKQGGELTYNNQQAAGVSDDKPVYLVEDMSTLKGKDNQPTSNKLPGKFGNANVYSSSDRTSRANLLTFLTAEDASIPDVAQNMPVSYYNKYIESATDTFFLPKNVNTYPRYTPGKVDMAQAKQISEFTQTMPDGRRYVYGLPAMNNLSREVQLNVNSSRADITTGLVTYDGGDESATNPNGREHFYSSTTTPAYAHSYLLTSALATDYVDVLGDGPTDDDMGGWTKFNYTLWDDDYRWRTPYQSNTAQYDPGFWSDNQDDKGSYMIGSRQQWHVRSVESKNYIAEFYVSKRQDGLGVTDPVYKRSNLTLSRNLTGAKGTPSYSYKLDSIRLFNKHDRYINEANATPIKTVIFDYDQTLCQGIPNTTTTGSGKLTLHRIYIRYGKSDKNLLSPYEFTYGANPNYNFADKDRWGNYKDHNKNTKLTTYEFPYTEQDGTDLDADKAPWNLTDIKLPSGGKIHVVYESDDYSFVQNKRTMQMVSIEGIGNSTALDHKTKLYEDLNTVNDYLYFKRIRARENSNLSLRDNYLEGTDLLYYSFSLDISGTGKYEHIKGYAHIDAMDSCSDNPDYCYIKIRKEHPGNHGSLLHPATILGVNTGRCYLPHIIYPGYLTGDEGAMNIAQALLNSFGELGSIGENPIVRLVQKKHIGRDINTDKSFIRLNRPGLTKKGGGIRVKQLTLSDSWNTLTNSSVNANADYGKNYSYTITDNRFGTISSGVASYEPIIGGDENPFRMPAFYTEESGRLLPKVEFFQEEPFGESFFPPPVVGYSYIKVSSIHSSQGRSSQSFEEYSFYTAKDFPIEVEHTNKEAPAPTKNNSLIKKTTEAKVFQGYVLRLNDMHGKPRSISNSVIKTDGTTVKTEEVSHVLYHYHEDANGKPSNKVLAVIRNRGSKNNYYIDSTTLGTTTDFTVDTRERSNWSSKQNINLNLNVIIAGIIPIPIPSAFFPGKEETETFRMAVTTKIVQRYGILDRVERMDHGIVSTSENVIYDSETGNVLLSKMNHEYGNDLYDLKFPAYWAYDKMGPAYTHVGYEEQSDSLIIESYTNYGQLHLNPANFFPGDEVLLTYIDDQGIKRQVKAWIMEDYRIVGTAAVTMPYPLRLLPPSNLHMYDNVVWVALRSSQNSSGSSLWPPMRGNGTYATTVTVKVLRSARRNMLDKNVQQTTLAQNPYMSSINDLIGGTSASTAFNKVLSMQVQEFSDKATPYGSIKNDTTFYLYNVETLYKPHMLPVDIDSVNKEILNRYVLGHRGNFRPVREFTYIDDRANANNVKTDGIYATRAHPYWLSSNNTGSGYTILTTLGGDAPYWKKIHEVSKYDVFGNVLEEIDATVNGNSSTFNEPFGGPVLKGKRTAAQYGYNKSLPTAVANNVQQRSFMFEGFEDFAMLVPKNLYFLYQNSYFFKTPFAEMFKGLDYGVGKVRNNLYGQDYRQYALTQNGNAITSAAAHTGNYSLLLANPLSIAFTNLDRNSEASGLFNLRFNVEKFVLDHNRPYLISFWFKPISGSPTSVINSIALEGADDNVYYGVSHPFAIKSGNVDGWYKAEFITTGMRTMTLTLPAGVYFDDIRLVPVDASMKSFVYDPVTFKLTAQLDENNFATFYEYDQEGLLVRVKKETDRGIMTVNESRRSNSKQ